ncbi:hypothetical protein C5L14_23255 [Labrys okinawensis]|uniref:Uncharacterized protein n=1 Tax=Labrys okinawensis TaxID=346911 RepID=A0A2S9Q7N7_9HYPH|nr:hypothetical protein [Labrys okinawensis]PRH85361.1 hypothetical protein C5L14_23255 [Labrys okinawensis]
MKILGTIAAALKGKTALTSTKLADLITQTEAETAAARRRLAELEAKRPDMAIADEADRRRYRSDLASTRDDVEDGEAALQSLRTKHTAAIEAEAEDGRKRTHKAAKARADELPNLIDEYGRLAQLVRDVVAKIAEIDGVVRTANSDLPADTAHIAGSSELRSVPAAPREIVKEKTVDLWVREGRREPASEIVQAKVREESNGRGYHRPEHSPVPEYYAKQWFTRLEYREAAPAVHAISFGEIVLPDAYAPKPKAERPVLVEHIPLKAAA